MTEPAVPTSATSAPAGRPSTNAIARERPDDNVSDCAARMAAQDEEDALVLLLDA